MSGLVLFANGSVGLSVLTHLIATGDKPVLCVVHDADDRRSGDELMIAAKTAEIACASWSDVTVDLLKNVQARVGVSAYFGFILKAEILDCFEQGILNLHPSFLPYNRGRNPNVWPLIDGTPAGVSIHLLDEAIDTGPLLVQRRVEVTPADTARSLYVRLEAAMIDLFVSQWAALKDNLVSVQKQEGSGTHHWGRELGRLKALDLDEAMTMRAAINRLRACTFEPHPGGQFTENGKRYQVRIQIEQVDPCD